MEINMANLFLLLFFQVMIISIMFTIMKAKNWLHQKKEEDLYKFDDDSNYLLISNNGKILQEHRIIDFDGNVLLENTKETRQVVKPSTGYIVTQLMTSVVKEGTGTAANFKQSNMPLAGKTGTTTDSKDLTFVGYTPYYVASIWYGYDRYDKKFLI